MPKPQTNVEFVTNLMEFSRYGGLVQVFVIQALDQYSKRVSEADPATLNNGFISGEAWVGIAKEIQRKLEERQ
jgi:hypothetical protein